MSRVFFRIAFLAVALGLTLVVFNFWGNFGRAMYNYLELTTAPDKPKNTGVVTMKIIPPPENKPACDKKHPCK